MFAYINTQINVDGVHSKFIHIESLQKRLLKVCYVPATSASLPRVSFFFSFLFFVAAAIDSTNEANKVTSAVYILRCLWASCKNAERIFRNIFFIICFVFLDISYPDREMSKKSKDWFNLSRFLFFWGKKFFLWKIKRNFFFLSCLATTFFCSKSHSSTILKARGR